MKRAHFHYSLDHTYNLHFVSLISIVSINFKIIITFVKELRSKYMEMTTNVLNNDCLPQVFRYLTLIDRFRLERVSQQFQNSIYLEKQFFKVSNDLVPNIVNEHHLVNLSLFRSVCQKCTDITTTLSVLSSLMPQIALILMSWLTIKFSML